MWYLELLEADWKAFVQKALVIRYYRFASEVNLVKVSHFQRPNFQQLAIPKIFSSWRIWLLNFGRNHKDFGIRSWTMDDLKENSQHRLQQVWKPWAKRGLAKQHPPQRVVRFSPWVFHREGSNFKSTEANEFGVNIENSWWEWSEEKKREAEVEYCLSEPAATWWSFFSMKYLLVVHQKQWNAFSKRTGAKIGLEIRDVGENAEGTEAWIFWSQRGI